VRELKGALEYAFVVTEDGIIDLDHLPPQLVKSQPQPDRSGWSVVSPEAEPGGLSQKEALVAALRRTGGNQSQAAKLLGVNRVTVYNRMKKYGIELKKVMQA